MNNILLIAQLIPAIIEMIKAVEQAIPDKGKGQEKLQAIRNILEVTVDGFAALWPSLEKVIATLVTLFNAVGMFKKG